MEQKPAEIIHQAREKAKALLIERLCVEVQRICDDFSDDTGLPVESISFNLVDCRACDNKGAQNIVSGVSINHEVP